MKSNNIEKHFVEGRYQILPTKQVLCTNSDGTYSLYKNFVLNSDKSIDIVASVSNGKSRFTKAYLYPTMFGYNTIMLSTENTRKVINANLTKGGHILITEYASSGSTEFKTLKEQIEHNVARKVEIDVVCLVDSPSSFMDYKCEIVSDSLFNE